MSGRLEFHPVANAFPLMADAELRDLASDIAANGLLEPIWLHEDGRIVDGRNRYLACGIAGIEPAYRTWPGGSLASFVWSLNGPRRHLTPSQKAAIATELLPELEREARERMVAGGGDKKSGREIILHPIPDAGKSSEKAAEIVGVNERYVSDAKKLKADSPEVFERVKSGELSIPEAKREVVWGDKAPRVPHVAQNSGENEWYTPAEYVAAARAVMGGIDLDPASSPEANEVVGARKFYTAEDDGLAHTWHGRVWMNPPYAQPSIAQFCEQVVREHGAGRVTEALVLVNNATETRWFQGLASSAAALCFPSGRVRFWNPSRIAVPLQGQAVVYFGRNTEAFSREFGRFGFVVSMCSAAEDGIEAA